METSPSAGMDTWCDPRDPPVLNTRSSAHGGRRHPGSNLLGWSLGKTSGEEEAVCTPVLAGSHHWKCTHHRAPSRPLRHHQPPQNGLPMAELQFLPSEPHRSALPGMQSLSSPCVFSFIFHFYADILKENLFSSLKHRNSCPRVLRPKKLGR